ncbi:MAG: hypothetical protein N2110_08375 [Flavobacteriales bacterium]|nr:hypothetical protein [Flavobacteriales bacterium]
MRDAEGGRRPMLPWLQAKRPQPGIARAYAEPGAARTFRAGSHS